MKKILMWGGIILVVIIVIGAIVGSGSGSNTERVSNSDSNTTTQSADSEDTSDTEKMTIANSVAKPSSLGSMEVVGEITNNDSVEHSATVKATFYDSENKIMGTAIGAVNNVAPGETKTFNLLSTDDVSGHSEFKVQVDTLL